MKFYPLLVVTFLSLAYVVLLLSLSNTPVLKRFEKVQTSLPTPTPTDGVFYSDSFVSFNYQPLKLTFAYPKSFLQRTASTPTLLSLCADEKCLASIQLTDLETDKISSKGNIKDWYLKFWNEQPSWEQAQKIDLDLQYTTLNGLEIITDPVMSAEGVFIIENFFSINQKIYSLNLSVDIREVRNETEAISKIKSLNSKIINSLSLDNSNPLLNCDNKTVFCPDGFTCNFQSSKNVTTGICLKKTDRKPLNFSCPDSEYVNCMPMVDEPQKWQCSSSFLSWAHQNCPGFKGAAY